MSQVAIRNAALNPPKPWELDVKGRTFYISCPGHDCQADEVRQILQANETYTGEDALYTMLNTEWCQQRPELCKPVSGKATVVRQDAQPRRQKTRTGGCSVCGGGRVR